MALPRFPLIVAHRLDEPSYGLLTRTAAHNGTRLYPAIFARYGIQGRLGVNNLEPAMVAYTCQADATAVARASPVTTTKSVELLGQVLHRDHFSVQRRRWCPECLKEEAYHRAWWDIAAITCCPKHGIDLVDQCGCKSRNAWQTFGITHCQAGHDLRQVPQTVAATEIAADRYLVARLLGTGEALGKLLDSISMGDAIIAMERVGQAWYDEDGGLRRARAQLGMRHLMCLGYRILMDLEVEFPKLLDRLMSNPGKRRGNWGINKAYGQFHTWVLELPPSPLATALREHIFVHANRNVLLKTGSSLAPDDQTQGYQLREAADLAGMSYGKFRRIAIELGLLPPRGVKGRPARLDREQVEEIASRFRGSKTMDAIADELGITYSAMMPIIEDGLLVPLMRAGRSGLNSYDFPADCASGLLASMPAVVRVSGHRESELIPLPIAAQRARITVSNGIRMSQMGRILVRGIDEKAIGLQRYLVDMTEVVNACRRQRLPGCSKREAAKLIGVPYNAMLDFVERGVISAIMQGKEVVVEVAEIERFQREYVAVPELSEILGMKRSRETIALLAKAGVEPVCPRPPFWKVLYRRDEAITAAMAIACH